MQAGNEGSPKAKKMKTNARSRGERSTYTARVIGARRKRGKRPWDSLDGGGGREENACSKTRTPILIKKDRESKRGDAVAAAPNERTREREIEQNRNYSNETGRKRESRARGGVARDAAWRIRKERETPGARVGTRKKDRNTRERSVGQRGPIREERKGNRMRMDRVGVREADGGSRRERKRDIEHTERERKGARSGGRRE